MGAINDPDVEDTGGNDSVDVEMNPDTSHDSSAPLLAGEDVRTKPHSIVRNNKTPSPVSWLDITTVFPWVGSIYNNLPWRDNKSPESPASWLQIIATAFPWVAMLLSLPALSITVDTQAISVLAFLQVVAIGSLGFLMSPKKHFTHRGKELDHLNDWPAAIKTSWWLLLSYIIAGLLTWSWLAGRPGSMWHRYELANEFDAKIDVHDALGKLVDCIQRRIPERNATIEEVTACLRGMGVREAWGG